MKIDNLIRYLIDYGDRYDRHYQQYQNKLFFAGPVAFAIIYNNGEVAEVSYSDDWQFFLKHISKEKILGIATNTTNGIWRGELLDKDIYTTIKDKNKKEAFLDLKSLSEAALETHRIALDEILLLYSDPRAWLIDLVGKRHLYNGEEAEENTRIINSLCPLVEDYLDILAVPPSRFFNNPNVEVFI